VVREKEGDVGERTVGRKWSEVDSEGLRRSAERRLRDVCGNDAGRSVREVREGCGRSIEDSGWIEGCTKRRQVSVFPALVTTDCTSHIGRTIIIHDKSH